MEEKKKYNPNISEGNDESSGDARDESRADKGEDEHTVSRHKITPDSLSKKDANHGHNPHTMDEHEEPDPTADESPDLSKE